MHVDNIKIPSANGNLASAIHYPEKQTNKIAILCPGYLDSKDYQHLVKLAETLAEQGYTAVRFDPMGTWESDGPIDKYTTTQYLNDIKNVLEYMLGKYDYKNILLGGHSRGGQLSILYAARDPRISAVLGIMPSTGRHISEQDRADWEKAGIVFSRRDLPGNRSGSMQFQIPFSHILDKEKYPPAADEVKKIKTPIILLAGELDDLVTPSEVKNIFDSANEPKSFIVLSGIGHNYRCNDKEVALVNNVIIEQLNLMNL